MKQAIICWKTLKAGIHTESDEGYSFAYDKNYLTMPEAQGISLMMPLREEPFQKIFTYLHQNDYLLQYNHEVIDQVEHFKEHGGE